jgi:signal transduction histidine kinase
MIQKFRQPYLVYLALVTGLGLFLLLIGLINFPNYKPISNFLLLITLAIVAQSANTSVPIAGKTSITYAIGHIISLAVVPFYGPAAAPLIEAVASITQWLFKPTDKTTWKRSWKQLGFNMGMFTISIYIAGWSLIWMQTLFAPIPILRDTVPWLIAAIINDQVNLFLLIGILYLQQRQTFNPFSFWKENLWASQIQLIITVLGSILLAFAIQHYDWIAVLVFFLPIAVSAYAFRLYVRQMKSHMDNLENIIDDRTHELQNLMREKDAFLAVLTHDMKTPLTSIGIYGELIKARPQLILEKPHMSEIIIQSQQTLLDIVNNILDLEKLTVEGSFPLEKEKFNLSASVEKVVETLRPQAIQKSISLETEISSPIIPFKADRSQFERIMQNLISNAIKYTPREGDVVVKICPKPNEITIFVVDSGYGIPEEELPYVFDRFRRVAKHKNRAAGTGLGLAITKQLVEAHGGKVFVSSQEGDGTTFTVHLPFEPII